MAGNANSGRWGSHGGTAQPCGAKTRRGTPCRAPAMVNGRCAVHGGKTPKGLLSHAWKHGRWSKYLGSRIADVVHEQMADPDRLSMEQELALLDARIAQLVATVGTAESPATWAALQQAMADFDQAQGQGKPGVAKMHAALAEVRRLATEGAGEAAAWREIADLINRRRVLVESEERRALAMGRAIPADIVLNMLASISSLVVTEVPDPAARRRIHERILAIGHGHKLQTTALPAKVLEAGRD